MGTQYKCRCIARGDNIAPFCPLHGYPQLEVMEWKERAQQLVNDHWDYHDVIIPIFLRNSDTEIYLAKKHWAAWYREIGIHFYKHAVEDVKEGKIVI